MKNKLYMLLAAALLVVGGIAVGAGRVTLKDLEAAHKNFKAALATNNVDAAASILASAKAGQLGKLYAGSLAGWQKQLDAARAAAPATRRAPAAGAGAGAGAVAATDAGSLIRDALAAAKATGAGALNSLNTKLATLSVDTLKALVNDENNAFNKRIDALYKLRRSSADTAELDRLLNIWSTALDQIALKVPVTSASLEDLTAMASSLFAKLDIIYNYIDQITTEIGIKATLKEAPTKEQEASWKKYEALKEAIEARLPEIYEAIKAQPTIPEDDTRERWMDFFEAKMAGEGEEAAPEEVEEGPSSQEELLA